jgi:hypothetical protein
MRSDITKPPPTAVPSPKPVDVMRNEIDELFKNSKIEVGEKMRPAVDAAGAAETSRVLENKKAVKKFDKVPTL